MRRLELVDKDGALGKGRPVPCELTLHKWERKSDEALAYRLGIILYLGICHYYVLFYFKTALSPHCARVTAETSCLLQDCGTVLVSRV